MSVSVTLPAMGESVTEATITRWLKKEGDRVEVDEPLLEVSTDKVDTEVPSPVAGTLLAIRVSEDETIDIGAELAVIGQAGAAVPFAAPVPAPAPAPTPVYAPAPAAPVYAPAPAAPAVAATPPIVPPAPQPPAPPIAAPIPAPAPGTPPTVPFAPSAVVAQAQVAARVDAPGAGGDGPASAYVTPLVRKLAVEHGVDLASVKGTGVGGRVRNRSPRPPRRTEPPRPRPRSQHLRCGDAPRSSRACAP